MPSPISGQSWVPSQYPRGVITFSPAATCGHCLLSVPYKVDVEVHLNNPPAMLRQPGAPCTVSMHTAVLVIATCNGRSLASFSWWLLSHCLS